MLKKVARWMEGWRDGWMDGAQIRVPDKISRGQLWWGDAEDEQNSTKPRLDSIMVTMSTNEFYDNFKVSLGYILGFPCRLVHCFMVDY